MNVLLDTHAFLWFISGNSQMSQKAIKTIESPENLKLVSIASLWEMGIKTGLGRLELNAPFERFIPEQMRINGFELLQMNINHISTVISLPFHHRDPFDRMLAAQCLVEGFMLLSCDKAFDLYKVNRLW